MYWYVVFLPRAFVRAPTRVFSLNFNTVATFRSWSTVSFEGGQRSFTRHFLLVGLNSDKEISQESCTVHEESYHQASLYEGDMYDQTTPIKLSRRLSSTVFTPRSWNESWTWDRLQQCLFIDHLFLDNYTYSGQ